MPYFLFKIDPQRNLDFIDSFTKYRDARDLARKLRAELPPGDPHTIKMVHAKNQAEAEHLLTEVREPRPAGEE